MAIYLSRRQTVFNGMENVSRLEYGRAGGGGLYRQIEITELYAATIKQAKYFFSETGFDINYEVIVAMFDDKDVMGASHEEKIIISDVFLEKGINEVVNTMIEEHIHLKYGVMDETRAFQTAIITEFISYMKKTNSFVI